MQPMQQPYLFISHSSRDRKFTDYLAAKLTEAGYRCWVDVESIPAGSTWPREIQKAVEECGALIVVMSETARLSEWVERETLLALDLRKPIFIARIDDAPLPIHLINRQFSDFRKRRAPALKKLLSALAEVSLTEPQPAPTPREERRLSPRPNEQKFFKYVKQLPDGEENARIAREIFEFAQAQADNISFSGRSAPAFHAHVWVGPGGVLVFSLRAYPSHPAVEVPLQYFQEFPPYDTFAERLKVIHVFNRILPDNEQLDDSRADRRPNIPLIPSLATPQRLKTFTDILAEIMQNLRNSSSS
jgi:hypothetical protein